MLKKALATAVAATMLFACSTDDDVDNTKKTPPSSSSENNTDGTSSPGNGDGSSSSENNTGGSSSSQMVFTLLYDFETESDYTIGYTFGKASLENDCVAPEEGEEECSKLDADGEPYRNWTPDGIFTLKNFSYNGGKPSEGDGGGLIIKNLRLNDYEAFRFDARSTANGEIDFRIKAEKDGNGAAFQKSFSLSSGSFESITILIDDNWQRAYNDTDIKNSQIFAYVKENATEIEFVLPVLLFDPNTSATKHTLEIDNFAVANK